MSHCLNRYHRFVPIMLLLALVVAFALWPDMALATDSSGGKGLPWESPLKSVRDSIKGPVAYAIALMGLVAAGATLVWGGEINEFLRRIIMMIFVISLLAGAVTILKDLMGMSAAVIF
jgi:type IV secretion system protein TrbC